MSYGGSAPVCLVPLGHDGGLDPLNIQQNRRTVWRMFQDPAHVWNKLGQVNSWTGNRRERQDLVCEEHPRTSRLGRGPPLCETHVCIKDVTTRAEEHWAHLLNQIVASNVSHSVQTLWDWGHYLQEQHLDISVSSMDILTMCDVQKEILTLLRTRLFVSVWTTFSWTFLASHILMSEHHFKYRNIC